MSERTYTLAEAERVRALESCARHGHDWSVLQSWGGGPHAVACGTCGWAGSVAMGERPKAPIGSPAAMSSGSDGASRPNRGQP